MNSRERFSIYVLLLGLLALNVLALLGHGGRVALATPGPSAADEVGPVEALRLAAASGEARELVLRNREGRLSWGEGDQNRVYSVGFVHIGSVLRQLISSAAYMEERETLQAELEEQEQELLDRRGAWEQQYGGVTPDDPEAEDARRALGELQQAFEQFRATATRRISSTAAEQIERAYRELVTAVNVVADRRGVDIVYRFIPPDDPFETDNPDSSMLAIRLRSVLRYPQGADITPEVLEELALEAE